MPVITGPNIRARLRNEVIKRAQDPLVQYLVPASKEVAKLPLADAGEPKAKAKPKAKVTTTTADNN